LTDSTTIPVVFGAAVVLVLIFVGFISVSKQLRRQGDAISALQTPNAKFLTEVNERASRLDNTAARPMEEFKGALVRLGSSIASMQNEMQVKLQEVKDENVAIHKSIEVINASIEVTNRSIATLQQSTSGKFADHIARNRSWLESPYPKLLKVIHNDRLQRIEQGARLVGLRFEGPISIRLCCERCREASPEKPYEIVGATFQFEKEAIKFYCKTGIALGLVCLPHHSLAFMIHDPGFLKKATEFVVQYDKLIDISKHMVPEVLLALAVDIFRKKQPAVSDADFFKAETELTALLSDDQVEFIELGGSSHLQFGKLLEEHDEQDRLGRRPYGGLVRVLEDDVNYKWVCGGCRGELKKKTEAPSSPISMGASA
jgi:hypothetical protein